MTNLGDALDRLEEALGWPADDEVHRDSAILRFTFVYELFWKTLKRFLAHEGVEANYPKEVFKKAYQAHWLEDEESWLGMIKDRNLVVHTYDEEMAIRMYERIQGYLPELRRTYGFLKTKFAEILTNSD